MGAREAKPPAIPAEPEAERGLAVLEQRERSFNLVKNEHWKVVGICVILAALVWAVFGQTREFGFVNYDDNLYVYENPDATKGLNLDGITQAFTSRELGLWNPLVTISHMLDCQLYGLNAGGHHFSNVLGPRCVLNAKL